MARHVARDMTDGVQKPEDSNFSSISTYLENQIAVFRTSLPTQLFKKVLSALWNFIAEVKKKKNSS